MKSGKLEVPKRDSARCQKLRREVFERDKGICSLCGMDAHAARQEFLKLTLSQQLMSIELLRAMGVSLHRVECDWWASDHILPVAEGGADELSNLRTLCSPCHKVETAALAKRLAKAKRRFGKFHKDGKVNGYRSASIPRSSYYRDIGGGPETAGDTVASGQDH